MGAGQAPVLALHDGRFPFAVVAGGALSVGFFVPGKPVHKDRPRVKMMPMEGGRHNQRSPCGWPQFYSPDETVLYEAHVGKSALEQLRSLPQEFFLPIQDCRIIASLRFNFQRPKSVRRLHMSIKPDLDNLEKAIYDGLVKHGVLKDDAPITDHSVCKRYADERHPEGVEVELTCLPL